MTFGYHEVHRLLLSVVGQRATTDKIKEQDPLRFSVRNILKNGVRRDESRYTMPLAAVSVLISMRHKEEAG